MNKRTKRDLGKKAKNRSSGTDKHNSKPDYTLLSQREREILLSLANGSLYKEIAMECAISIDTVKKHCKNIYKKLEARNRTEAIQKSGAFDISFKKMK
jgi:DNA-binding NarL/FixJ family response regulator